MEIFPKALKKLSDREIARQTGLDAQTISRIRWGGAVRPDTRNKLNRFSRRSATAPAP